MLEYIYTLGSCLQIPAVVYYEFGIYTVQLSLNFIHVCQYTHVPARLPRVNLKNQACTCTVAHNFDMRAIVSEYM